MQSHGVFSYVYSIRKGKDMKYAYVVYGSEDGVIGCYSNKRAAVAHAKNYAGDVHEISDRKWGVSVYGDVNAEVQVWPFEREFEV